MGTAAWRITPPATRIAPLSTRISPPATWTVPLDTRIALSYTDDHVSSICQQERVSQGQLNQLQGSLRHLLGQSGSSGKACKQLRV
jgi:hypothetical protein